MNEELLQLIRDLKDAIDEYADMEGTDIIYGELRRRVEAALGGRMYEV